MITFSGTPDEAWTVVNYETGIADDMGRRTEKAHSVSTLSRKEAEWPADTVGRQAGMRDNI